MYEFPCHYHVCLCELEVLNTVVKYSNDITLWMQRLTLCGTSVRPSSLSLCQCLYGSSGLWQLCPFIRPLFVSQPTTGLSEYARSAVNNSHPLLWEIPPSIFLVFLLPTNVSCRGYMGHSWKGGWEVLHAAAMPFFSLTVYWMHLASLRGRSKPHTDTSKQWFFTRPRSLILTAWLADQWLAEASLESAPESLHPPPPPTPSTF